MSAIDFLVLKTIADMVRSYTLYIKASFWPNKYGPTGIY